MKSSIKSMHTDVRRIKKAIRPGSHFAHSLSHEVCTLLEGACVLLEDYMCLTFEVCVVSHI